MLTGRVGPERGGSRGASEAGGPRPGVRANAALPPGCAHAHQRGGKTWPLRGGPAPAQSPTRAVPMARRPNLGMRALWTARGPPEASGRTGFAAPARPAPLGCRPPFSEPLGDPGRSPPPAPPPRPLPPPGCQPPTPAVPRECCAKRAPLPPSLPPRLAGASDPALYSRFIIDEMPSQNEGEKVSRAGTAPGAELHRTLAAPRRLASSCLCKAVSLRGAAFA